MVKSTAKIDRYDGSNVYFVGKEKPLFVPPEDIQAAMKNYPAGKVVTYKTKDKQKGTLEGMATPTAAELKSYEQDQMAGEGKSTTGFQPAGTLPRDPKAEQDRAKAILQQNLKDKQAESAGQAAHPPCWKAALCPKVCDGTKDPCPFKPKTKLAQPPTEPRIDAPGVSGTTNPPKGTGSAPPATQRPEQTPPVNGEAILEMFENIANADPRVIESLRANEPALMKAFDEKIKQLITDLNGRQKGPVEESRFPTDTELLNMVYNYDTYWKAKTILDLMARQDIRKQVTFKNWMDCLNAAIALLNDGVHKPTENEILTTAKILHDGIHEKMGGSS